MTLRNKNLGYDDWCRQEREKATWTFWFLELGGMLFQSTDLENWKGTSVWELLMWAIEDFAVKNKGSNETAKILELRDSESP